MKYHIIAFFFGFVLDLFLGDPYFMPHPIRLIGGFISYMEKILRKEETRTPEQEKRRGIWLVLAVTGITLGVSALILGAAYACSPVTGCVVETIMTYQILAAKCLKVESMKVYTCLKENDLDKARKAVSMIVGRDTACLDETGVAKAAIETVAENTSDGVIAPLLYTALGGPVLGFCYKAVNTMDSMVGYKNDKYFFFGRAAARLDDVVNYLPARISAYGMILSAGLLGKSYSLSGAFRIYKRDRYNHASPNSAHTEAVCAGALGIQLAGDASYFGKIVKKPYIGDPVRKVEVEDIYRANRLMYMAAWMVEILCLLMMLGIEICL